MPFSKLPVPDQWRLNYPHFIGNPTALRVTWVFAVIIAVLFFGAACYWYREQDHETITEITFNFRETGGWQCESIGVWDGTFEFLVKDDSIPYSLSTSFTSTYISMSSGSGNGYIPNLTNFTSYELATVEVGNVNYSPKLNSQYSVLRGNAPNIDTCKESFKNWICNAESIAKSSYTISNVGTYRFTYTLHVTDTNDWNVLNGDSFDDIIQSRLMLYDASTVDLTQLPGTAQNTRTIFGDLQQYQALGIESASVGYIKQMDDKEYWMTGKTGDDTNLCTVIEQGIINGDIIWGVNLQYKLSEAQSIFWSYGVRQAPGPLADNHPFQNITVNSFIVNCEWIENNNDYCIVNISNQFSISEPEPVLRGTALQQVAFNGEVNKQFIMLGAGLGDSCGDRWESVCEESYKWDAFCSTLYISPFSCVLTQKRDWFSTISLSFAATQLFFTILVLVIGCMFRNLSNPVFEKDRAHEIMELEMSRNARLQHDGMDGNLTVAAVTNGNNQHDANRGQISTEDIGLTE